MLEIDHSNSCVLLKTEVVAFFHHISSVEGNFNKNKSKKIKIHTFLFRKSSNDNNISRSQRDFPKVFTDEPNGRQTVSTKILPNASREIEKFLSIIAINFLIYLQQVKQQNTVSEYQLQLVLFFAKNNEFDH